MENKVKRKFWLPASLLLGIFLFSGASAVEDIRYPAVAGAFYPADKAELSAMIDGFLTKAPSNKEMIANGNIAAIIVPHAGYAYSGQVAAYAYKMLSGLQFDTVILLGPYHEALFHGASVWRSGYWSTPLGSIPVDSELADAISKKDNSFKFLPENHFKEHSLEVELPFLQKVLKDFKIVPITVSDPSLENCKRLAKAIFKSITGKKVLIVTSTDMSHYYPDAKARKMDQLTLELLRKKDSSGLLTESYLGNSELCGIAATVTLLEIIKLMRNVELQVLKYANSGDVTGEKDKVVGYGASVVYTVNDPPKNRSGVLDKNQEKELLKIARKTIEGYIGEGRVPEFEVSDPLLKENRAVFVTLRKQGELRGCIGRTSREEPLYLAVRHMAIESATRDPRFEPVRPDEIKDLSIEISVLSVPEKIRSVDEIVMSKHGVIVSNGSQGGVFLPKVADETGWGKEEFLNELCSQKAGLPPNCWKDPATELYTFTAQDFGENE